jgi:predicted enzyme related to lactoylglutathione lyase
MSRVVHFEIYAENPQRAIAFYSQLFGWQFTQWGEMDYWMVTTGPDDQSGINGGLAPRRSPIDGEGVIAFVCTVDVPDVDACAESILAAGGTIAHPKMPIPTIGWLAYGKDTEGNIFGVMTPDPQAA